MSFTNFLPLIRKEELESRERERETFPSHNKEEVSYRILQGDKRKLIRIR